jgi:(p)ppGpp synthase/HD superfamily hydrolase
MKNIEEHLQTIGISGTHSTAYLQQVSTFQEQLHTAFPPTDTARILEALELMVELHIDQAPRPDGTPYIEHPLAIASQVLEAMAQKDADLVVAALLHDAVEDQMAKLAQKVTQRQVREGETEEQLALDAIEWLTHSSRVRRIISGLNNPDFDVMLEKKGVKKRTDDGRQAAYSTAKNELYAEHVRDAIRDPDVALVKVFDFAANALNLDAVLDETKRTRYLNKYTPVIGILLDRLRDTANPLNITQQKREELLARFTYAQQTRPG